MTRADASSGDGSATLVDDIAACRWLRGPVGRAMRQPLSRPVPADDAAYLRRKGCARLAFRVAKRRVQLAWSGQHAHLRQAIDPAWTRLLWVHHEAPQIGDMLMDLAPRSLLVAQGRLVDIATTPALAALLRGDRWLHRVLASPDDVDAGRYDAVVTSSHVPRALALKRSRAAALPWVALAGDYTVPDYQRGLFNATRLADLLGVRLSDSERAFHARQKLDVPPKASPWPGDTRAVAIAVGGVWASRSYARWPDVVTALHAAGVRRIRLLGSDNGRAAADAVLRSAPRDLQVDDGVGRLDLHATHAALAGSGLALCADGGLMHLAVAAGVPLVALFHRDVDPAWRLPPDLLANALRSQTASVSDLSPRDVAALALRSLEGGR